MYSEKILTKQLYDDIGKTAIIDQNKFDPLFLTSNLYGLAAFLALDKVYISLNQTEETTTNCGMVNIGKSGAGKTTASNFILRHLKNIEEDNFRFNEKVKKFTKACKDLAGVPDIFLGTGRDDGHDEKIKFVDEYYKNNFEKDPLIDRDDLYFTTNPADLYRPQYIATIFTEEGLRKGFDNTLNNTLLLNSPEMEILFENLGRTSISNNPHTTLIDLIDGFKGVKLLVGGNNYEKGKVVVITNTIHSKMQKFKKSFFEQTTAFRTFFVLGDDSPTDFFNTRLGGYNKIVDTNDINLFEHRIRSLTELLLNEFGDGEEPMRINLNTQELYNLVEKALKEIRQHYFQEQKIEFINNNIIEGISNRLTFKLLQTILILHILNTAYDHVVNPVMFFKFKIKNISGDAIARGIECYKYFLDNMFSLLQSEVKNDLNETQQFIVNGISEGDQMLVDEFIVKLTNSGYTNKNGDVKRVSKKTIQNFLRDDKSKPYLEIYQSKAGIKTIKRKVGV